LRSAILVTKKEKLAYIHSQLLDRIRDKGSLSRVELARELNLVPSTIGLYVSFLQENGYLQLGERKSSEGGRPAAGLTLNPDAGTFIGVDFDARHIHCVALDFSGKVIGRRECAVSENDSSEILLTKISENIELLCAPVKGQLLGIGVGVPGLVDPVRGIAVRYASAEKWQNLELQKQLETRFGVPVSLENNVRAMALAELVGGWGQETDHFVCITVRSGLGAALVLNRELYRGADFFAGEIGLWPAPGEFPSHRSLQDIASMGAIHEQLASRSFGINQPTTADIIEAYKAGDSEVLNCINQVVEYIGWAAAQLTCVLNPQKIILCGPLNALGENLTEPIKKHIDALKVLPSGIKPVIVATQFDEYQGAFGSGAYAIRQWRL
jgi:N-acetylglucosamine repressor